MAAIVLSNKVPPQEGDPQFHVCVLTYGNHFGLAERCLDSIERYFPMSFVKDVRIGFNAACPETHVRARQFAERSRVPCWGYNPGVNVGKYPLMRRMFKSPPLDGTHVVWFDDDSYLNLCYGGIATKNLRYSVDEWWVLLCSHLGGCESSRSVLGSVYHLGKKDFDLRFKKSWYGIRDQPWYNNKPPPKLWNESKFATGGWWIATTALLKAWDWPIPELHHNGGDVLLGELCRQRGYPVHHFNTGVKINADEQGKESAAPRRGITTPIPFLDYTPGTDPQAYRDKCISAWHNFPCVEYPLRPEDNSCNTTSGIST